MISFCIGMLFAMLAAGADRDSSLLSLALLSLTSIAFMIRGIYVVNKNVQLQ